MRFHRRGEDSGWRALHRNAEDGVPYRVGADVESRLERLKTELLRRLDCAEDSVRVYKLQSLRYVELDQLGVASPVDSVVI
ncbi:MAG: CRISPR-associated endonuclease Cas2 [Deltaproteobacteria bacterium]|nr:CRISPR-associated endonuclease Cas2 [Deltaproteobacteria bacterium]